MKIFSRPFRIILLVTFIEALAYAAILPFLPFRAQEFGASPFTVGAIFAGYSFFQLLVSPLLGKLSDRVGRKSVLIMGQAGTFAGFLLLGVSHSVLLIFLSRIVDGATGGNQTVSYAATADITDEKNRVQAFGYLGTSVGLGLLVGPALGALLMHFGFAVLVFCVAGLSLSTLAITAIWFSETRPENTPVQSSADRNSIFSIPDVKPILFKIFFTTLALNIFLLGFSLFAQKQLDYGIDEVGRAFAFMGLLGISIQVFLMRPAIKWWGNIQTLLVGQVALACGLLMLASNQNAILLPISLGLIMFGLVFTAPILGSILTKLAPSKQHGLLLGINQSLNSVCQILGPLIAGVLLMKPEPWLFGVTAGAIATISLFVPIKNSKI